jgi:hypothetical protein
MGRRVSARRIGAPGFGGLIARQQTITTDDNKDIQFDPTGTGRVLVEGHMQLQNASNLRFGDANDSNYVAFRAPNAVPSDITWTLPDADGTLDQVIVTDGNGVLSWANKSLPVTDNTSDSNNNYLLLSTITSGDLTAARVTSTKLTFQPSTGTLTCTELSAGTITETSSITLKENISPIENALDSILKLTGVTYDRKDGSSKGEAGLIAESVNQVLPNLVTKDTEGNPEGICYTKLSAYLIEAVKILKSELDNLKKVN